ncbi:hypothetical protein T492DRAFT_956396 [Pavlovales sp. CCMP2436]|nr:hypothetical protein T492DRAFT_956396 [Pavlovales sp. CCMP2436]
MQGKAAMLGAEGVLYKPVQKGEKGRREVNFYEMAGEIWPTLAPFLPAYFGTHEFAAMRYLAMEDIAIRFREPCVLDLKIGVRTYEPTATREKIDSELSKCPGQEAVGFRPCGMRVYGTRTRQYRCRNKDWGRAVTPETAPSLLAEFVCDDDAYTTVRRIRRVIPPLVQRLRALEKVTGGLSGLRLYASSIVIVYEGRDDEAASAKPGEPPRPAVIDLRVVDFAHWVQVEEGGVDEGYITGLQNVIHTFESIGAQASSFARQMETTVSSLPQFELRDIPALSRDPSSAGDASHGGDSDVDSDEDVDGEREDSEANLQSPVALAALLSELQADQISR